VEVSGESNIDEVEFPAETSQFDHFGEATSTMALRSQGHGRFLTDDRGARFEAR